MISGQMDVHSKVYPRYAESNALDEFNALDVNFVLSSTIIIITE